MKLLKLSLFLIALVGLSSCEVQSDITKKSVEKYATSPTPVINIPTPEPVDPADVVTVDTAQQQGPPIIVFKAEPNKTVNCDKYNNLTINGDAREVTVKGACKKLMINGDKNKISMGAFSEIVINGTENEVKNSGYVNGKRPFVTDNGGNNNIEKVPMGTIGSTPSTKKS